MAITWGATVTNSSNGMRLGYDIARSGSTMTIYIYVNTKYSVDDVSNNFYVEVGGTAVYNDAVAIETYSNSGGWSDANTVHIGTFTTSSEGNIGIYASLTGINVLSGLKAELSATVTNYTSGTRPSLYIRDNGNNTATLYGYLGKSGAVNDLLSSTLYYTTNGALPADSSWYTTAIGLGSTSEGYYEKTINIPAGCTKIIAITYCTFRCNTTYNESGNLTTDVVYYGEPGYPGKPILHYDRQNPALREEVHFSWDFAQPGENVPVGGYRLRIYKNGSILTGINPNNGSESYWDTGSANTNFSFTSETFSFNAGDKVRLGIYSYGYDGAGNQKFNGGGIGEAQVLSDEYTFINAAVVRLKVSGQWKEGQVYIKVAGVWKEADSIYVKQNDSWKEST